MSVWLNHYAARMTLMRDLGVMRLDEYGLWIDEPLEMAERLAAGDCPLPPPVPSRFWNLVPEVTPQEATPLPDAVPEPAPMQAPEPEPELKPQPAPGTQPSPFEEPKPGVQPGPATQPEPDALPGPGATPDQGPAPQPGPAAPPEPTAEKTDMHPAPTTDVGPSLSTEEHPDPGPQARSERVPRRHRDKPPVAERGTDAESKPPLKPVPRRPHPPAAAEVHDEFQMPIVQ
jgi:hypothetical protein